MTTCTTLNATQAGSGTITTPGSIKCVGLDSSGDVNCTGVTCQNTGSTISASYIVGGKFIGNGSFGLVEPLVTDTITNGTDAKRWGSVNAQQLYCQAFYTLSNGVYPRVHNSYEMGGSTAQWSSVNAKNFLCDAFYTLPTGVYPKVNNTIEMGGSTAQWYSVNAKYIRCNAFYTEVNGVYPKVHNSYPLGASNLAWSKVYSGGGFVTTSSIKSKEEIVGVEVKQQQANFKAIRPVQYKMKGKNLKTFGIIAEELALIYPTDEYDLVDLDENGEVSGVCYTALLSPMILIIQDLMARIEELEKHF